MKVPATLGACADRLHIIKSEKTKLNEKLKTLEVEERAIKDKLIDALPKSDLEGVSGRRAKVRIVTKQVPTVKNWDQLRRYVVKNQAWELLQKRCSSTAFRERWEDGVKVPGVEPFNVVDVSVTKL